MATEHKLSLMAIGGLKPALLALLPSVPAAAAPTQQDVFRSIQESVGGQTESPTFLPYAAGIAGLLLLLVWISQRQKQRRVIAPRSLNHQGKLLKEIVKAVPIRNREMKQLKVVAENVETDAGQPSPLTLLLCPSLMARTIQGKRLKVDRRALASIARKAGLVVTKK